MKYTEKSIQNYLWKELIRKNHNYIVPNSKIFYYGEADLISVTGSDYINEYEIKVTKQDIKQDHKKKKFKFYKEGFKSKYFKIPNYFWYVVPIDIYSSIDEFIIPDYAGIMAVDNGLIYIKRKPKLLNKNKIGIVQKETLTRSLLWKYWNKRIK